MSGGYQSGPPTELGPLLRRLSDAEARIRTLETQRATLLASVVSNTVILTDSAGVAWKLGVTTAGATTWTQV